MSVCKLIWYDIKNGIFKKMRFLIVPFLALLECLYTDMLLNTVKEYNSVDTKTTVFDFLTVIYRGCEPLLKFKRDEDPPDMPIFWVGIFVFAVFIGFDYLHNDLTQFGMQMIIRTKERTKWWLCKCLWCLCSSVVFFVLFVGTVFVFCIFNGYDLSFKNNVDILEIFSQSSVVYHPKMINSISKIQSVMMFLSPLIVIATLNMLQMLMTLFFKPMYSYMFNISLLSIGFLSDSIFAFSRCAMPIYSDIFLIGGFDIKGAFVLCAILIAISVIIGFVYFKRYDILPDKEDN